MLLGAMSLEDTPCLWSLTALSFLYSSPEASSSFLHPTTVIFLFIMTLKQWSQMTIYEPQWISLL